MSSVVPSCEPASQLTSNTRWQTQAASDLALGLDELVVNTWAHDPAVRRRSYALLAREFGLEARAA